MLFAPGHRALRKGRVSLPAHVYLLTTVTARRQALFGDPLRARAVCKCMVDPVCWPHAALLCWVLMPDHWHGLVLLDATGDLCKTMNQWKAIATKSVHHTGHVGAVWSRGFHDRAVRREQSLLDAARYIVSNPRRAGLVSNILAYPYWDCVWYQPDPRASHDGPQL